MCDSSWGDHQLSGWQLTLKPSCKPTHLSSQLSACSPICIWAGVFRRRRDQVDGEWHLEHGCVGERLGAPGPEPAGPTGGGGRGELHASFHVECSWCWGWLVLVLVLLDCDIYEVIVCLEQKSPLFQYCRLIDWCVRVCVWCGCLCLLIDVYVCAWCGCLCLWIQVCVWLCVGVGVCGVTKIYSTKILYFDSAQ